MPPRIVVWRKVLYNDLYRKANRDEYAMQNNDLDKCGYEIFFVISFIQIADHDSIAGGCMCKLIIAEINTNMRDTAFCAEEYKVSKFHFFSAHLFAGSILLFGAPGESEAENIAHHVTGKIVAEAAQAGVALHRLPLETMKKVEPRITDEVFGVLSVDRSVKSRTSYGGTAPKNVRSQAKKWLKRLEKSR
jgi:hypothetical protein